MYFDFYDLCTYVCVCVCVSLCVCSWLLVLVPMFVSGISEVDLNERNVHPTDIGSRAYDSEVEELPENEVEEEQEQQYQHTDVCEYMNAGFELGCFRRVRCANESKRNRESKKLRS